jgi:hypothetical protein
MTIGEKELLRQMYQAMHAVYRRLEYYTEREINSPSNHQEFAREAQEELDAFHTAMVMYNEWAKLNFMAAPTQTGEAGESEAGK